MDDYKDMRIHEYMDTDAWRHEDQDTRIPGYLNIWIHEYKDTRIHEYIDIYIHT